MVLLERLKAQVEPYMLEEQTGLEINISKTKKMVNRRKEEHGRRTAGSKG